MMELPVSLHIPLQNILQMLGYGVGWYVITLTPYMFPHSGGVEKPSLCAMVRRFFLLLEGSAAVTRYVEFLLPSKALIQLSVI
jgi:hypothetical protein